VLKGAKYPSGTKRTAAGAVLTQFPGGAGESVGNGLSVASGSEKSTVTLVSKAAPAVPGAGETDVIVKGLGGTSLEGDQGPGPAEGDDQNQADHQARDAPPPALVSSPCVLA
jgi:hypothetical protein